MMAHAVVWASQMGFNLQSPMLSLMHHEESNLDHRRPHAPGRLHHHQDPAVGTRQSLHRATQICVWIFQVTTRAMGIFCGCGIAMERSRSAGFLIMGRFALVLMSRNASMQEVCRTQSSCSCGIAMDTLSKPGDTTLMHLGFT